MHVPFLSPLLEAVGKRIVACTVLGERLIVTACSRVRGAACPECGRHSRQLHGAYWRRLADCACLGHPVTLELEIRRFKCRNRRCARRTFSEDIEHLTGSRQRRTRRLAQALHALGIALGGRAGARLAARLGMRVSGDTVLRTLRSTGCDAIVPAPTVIGIDDWALARGHRYGTIVVDLQRRCPVALLADRTAETVAAWLREQPQVRVIARDRAGAYAEAACSAAPAAVQVADRWHLLANVRDAIERVLSRHAGRLREAAAAVAAARAPALPQQHAPEPKLQRPPTAVQQRIAHNRARRLQRYEEAVRRHAAGEPIRAIAREMGLDRRTVRRFVRAERFPERAQRPPAPRMLDAYRSCAEELIDKGCPSAAQLWRELAARGYAGSYRCVSRAFAQLRGDPASKAQRRQVAPPAPPAMPVPSTRRACGWLLGWRMRDEPPEPTERRAFTEQLCRIEPAIGAAREFALRLIAIVQQRDVNEFDQWLAQASRCAVDEMRRFALGIEADLAAVRAALTTPWSSGQVEGQINRLKLLKRQMYGRAKLDLLRIRLTQTV